MDYPAWICSDCGKKYGRNVTSMSTIHEGDICGWCGEEKLTTEPRDYGYPDLPAQAHPAAKTKKHTGRPEGRGKPFDPPDEAA